MNKNLQKGISIFFAIALIAVIIICDYFGYIPVKYDYTIGSVATTDIYAPRGVIDNFQTELDAKNAKNSVKTISVRSDSISDDNLSNIKTFFQIVRQSRANLVDEFGTVSSLSEEDRDGLINDINDALEINLSDSDADALLSMSYYAFNYIEDKANSISEVLMMENFEEDTKYSLVELQINNVFEADSQFESYSNLLSNILTSILVQNTIIDSDKTKEAANNAYNSVLNNPVEIEMGTKIVAANQVINEHEYQLLKDLDLIRSNSFSLMVLLRISVYVIAVTAVLILYVNFNLDKFYLRPRLLFSLILAFIIPIVAAIYSTGISSNAIFILFFTSLCATYLGITNGVILSVFELVYVLPIYSFDMEVIFTTLVGIVVCAVLAGRKNTKNTSAGLIIFSAIGVVIASVVYNFFNASIQQHYLNSILWASISTLISVVFSVGMMPIFELLSDSVSPIKLIDLSQPSQPLLKRLSIEAPGTYQHSLMVANLADAAADAIGADALLCRVASYFHDIGKLENPRYFTENQEGYNPHDDISPTRSAEIITSHTVDGVSIAKKNKLPQPIIDIISEHHGNSYPSYFYKKACDQAIANGVPTPLAKDFSYNGLIPQTKESAIIMLADICEATLKSKKDKIANVADAEIEIRRLIKDKIDHDQLRDSHLSFDDVEKIVDAFTLVYEGQLHGRINYQNENKPK